MDLVMSEKVHSLRQQRLYSPIYSYRKVPVLYLAIVIRIHKFTCCKGFIEFFTFYQRFKFILQNFNRKHRISFSRNKEMKSFSSSKNKNIQLSYNNAIRLRSIRIKDTIIQNICICKTGAYQQFVTQTTPIFPRTNPISDSTKYVSQYTSNTKKKKKYV